MKLRGYAFLKNGMYLYEDSVDYDITDDTLSGLPFKDVFRIGTELSDGTTTWDEYIGFDDTKSPRAVASLCSIFNLFQEDLLRDCLKNGLFGDYPYVGYDCLGNFDEVQSKKSPIVFVKEDPNDSDYLVFDFGSLDVDWLISERGRTLVRRVSKKEFWSLKFSQEYPDMKPIKLIVRAAVNMFEKLNIPSDKLNYVMIDCRLSLLIDTSRMVKAKFYKVLEGISLSNEMPSPCGGRQDGYGVAFILGANWKKNPLCLGALRYIKNSELGKEIFGTTNNDLKLMSNPDFYEDVVKTPENAKKCKLREELLNTEYKTKIRTKGISDKELYAKDIERLNEIPFYRNTIGFWSR